MRLLSDDISIYEITFLRSTIACLFPPLDARDAAAAIRVTRWKLLDRSVATYDDDVHIYGIACRDCRCDGATAGIPLFTVLFAAMFLRNASAFMLGGLAGGMAGALSRLPR